MSRSYRHIKDYEYEIDDFVVPAAVVDANEDEKFIVEYISATDYFK